MIKPLFSRQYIAMAFRKTYQDESYLNIRWYHVLFEKMTFFVYLSLYPLAKIPVVNFFWEFFIRECMQGTIGFFLRAAYWRVHLKKIGIDVFINSNVHFWKPYRIEIGSATHLNIGVMILGHDDSIVKIGNYVHVSSYTLINGRGGVIIEDYSSIGAHSAIYSGTHYHKFPNGKRAASSNMWPIDEQYILVSPVVIHKKATIRWGCVILPGVEIHEWSVVGANSVVKKDVPFETVVAGCPARVIGENKDTSVS